MLALVLGIGVLIAIPQLWYSLRYYPRSIRSGKTYAHKTELGNISLWHQCTQAIAPNTEPIDGVFGTEACTFIGIPALLLVPFAGSSPWWIVLILSISLAMGKRFPLYRWTHWLHLRNPARYCYFVGLSLAMLSLQAFVELPEALHAPIIFLQAISLLLTLPRLWPMQPYCQRWERPSRAFGTPLTQYLVGTTGRVSGLPYPLRTGQVNQIRTLGYNGGSQARWMARFRQDPNPNGSGAHDWFALNEDSDLLDWYGVRYAYTYRLLRGKWRPTPIPHLYENTKAQEPPAWNDGELR